MVLAFATLQIKLPCWWHQGFRNTPTIFPRLHQSVLSYQCFHISGGLNWSLYCLWFSFTCYILTRHPITLWFLAHLAKGQRPGVFPSVHFIVHNNYYSFTITTQVFVRMRNDQQMGLLECDQGQGHMHFQRITYLLPEYWSHFSETRFICPV